MWSMHSLHTYTRRSRRSIGQPCGTVGFHLDANESAICDRIRFCMATERCVAGNLDVFLFSTSILFCLHLHNINVRGRRLSANPTCISFPSPLTVKSQEIGTTEDRKEKNNSSNTQSSTNLEGKKSRERNITSTHCSFDERARKIKGARVSV